MRRKSNAKGYSLVEVLIGGGLLVLGVFAAYSLFNNFSIYFATKQKKLMDKNESALLAETVQKRLAGGDLKFYLFTGQNILPRARAILPLPSRCVDFSFCPQSSSVLFANYDRSMAVAATVICQFDADRLLVDIGKTNFGTAVIDGLGFKVNSVNPVREGRLALENGQVVATVVAPTAALWQSTGDVVAAPNTPASYTNPSCLANATLIDPLDPTLGPDYTKLFLVRVRPLIFTQFTTSGAADVGSLSATVTNAALGAVFPLRLINANISILGMKQRLVDPPPAPAVYEYTLFIDDCAGASLPGACVGANQLSLGKLTDVSFQYEYSIALEPAFSQYEIVTNGGVASPLCTGTCRALPFGTTFIRATIAGESFENLDPAEFTLLKQDVLGKIRVEHRAKDRKAEVFEVRFQ